MTLYTYSLTAYTARGNFYKAGYGSESDFFKAAVAIDREGGELLSAVREVWEESGGIAKLLRIESYSMGFPVVE